MTPSKGAATAKRRTARKRPAAMAATSVVLDASTGASLQTQLMEALRAAIVAGRLAPGTRLLSTRAMAEQLDLSRNTVLNAYSRLLEEGYLVGHLGSGTYVARELPERVLRSERVGPLPPAPAHTPGISRRGRAVAMLPDMRLSVPGIPPSQLAFRMGTPSIDAFPSDLWGRLLNTRWRRSWGDLLQRAEPAGHPPLRRAVADYLATSRGVRCVPEQVIIVNGAQQAMSLAAQVLLDPGDAAWVEDPGYFAYRGALVAAGATLVPVPVDAEGLDVEAGKRLGPEARLAVVTPAHQFPLGVAMSKARRQALLSWAARSDAWIVEDDYDSEFRYEGRPLLALQGMAPDARVLYIGTFSKVVSPALRVGYLVVPEPLVDAFTAARRFADGHTPVVEQAVVADFLNDGHFSRHVRRMRVLYGRRQEALVEAASRELRGRLDVSPLHTGMHLVGWLPEGEDDRAATARVLQAGVLTQPLSAFRVQSQGRGALLLGYACVPEERIPEGVRMLARALR
ncbi:GntR family transcriptional regulator [Myxococcus stipitatus DSM 14675]|uniref:GntR family transcriptional regulator n=1 Tax=Myxococcus stipitatus (strain DSM 14675 / JCM 12634 / Mx s8) TaxID=1278073 RepID=L7U657_MYXSD|nr:PLP-dependent aminotransferase family protein [Myxococcus stipitatus]AGC43077.1 GntR family transcriptional regulator [Myxococcus stipitatus DSM 14675]